MNMVYNKALYLFGSGGLDFTSDTFRALALSAASDVNPDDDDVAAVLARGGTTEVDSGTITSYARQNLAYTGTTNQAGSYIEDDTNDRVEWYWDDIVFDLSTGGPGDVDSVLVYLFDTNDAGSTPLFLHDINKSSVTSLTVQAGSDGAVHAVDSTP